MNARRSIWLAAARPTGYPQLAEKTRADVVVVGGGITGATAAYHLASGGRKVVLLEAGEIGAGTTGASTGNLHVTLDDRLSSIEERWDAATAVAVARSRESTIDAVQRLAAALHIECGFVRCPHYLIATDEAQHSALQQEYATLSAAGLQVKLVDTTPVALGAPALRIEGQAQFNPAEYVRGLAGAAVDAGCGVYERSPVLEIDYDERLVTTPSGAVRGDAILLATHTPKGFNILQTELGPYREYALAALTEGEPWPAGIYWTLEDPGHSVRSYTSSGQTYAIVIGEKHKTGQHEEDVDYYERVEEYARQHLALGPIAFRWSAQHYRSADGLPYIGKSVGADHVYVATGFGTNGLVYGALAGEMIARELLGASAMWSEIYAARRFAPAQATGTLLRENLDFIGVLARGHLSPAELREFDNLAPGEGAVLSMRGKKIAAYRNEDGTCSAMSAVCPHLGCIVEWNRLETSWDCPCHGSRFACQGSVLEGPAVKPLTPVFPDPRATPG